MKISPHATIVDATDEDVARFYGPIEINANHVVKAMRRGDLVAGLGGLIEIEPGTWHAFFEVPAHLRSPWVFRHIRAAFDEATERGATTIRAFCDTRIPGAERLMRHLGFQPIDETLEDKVYWQWQL